MILEPSLFLQPSIFMQRLGHVRLLLPFMKARRRDSLEGLSTKLNGLITVKVPRSSIPHENLDEWIETRQQLARYSEQSMNPEKLVFLQDAYLSDPKMPSYTGSLTPATTTEIVKWAIQLGLLNGEKGSITSLGETMTLIDSRTGASMRPEYDAVANPYLLQRSALPPWAMVALTSDWKILRRLLLRLPNSEFDRSLAGDTLCEVLDEILQEISATKGQDLRTRRLLATLQGQVAALRKQVGQPTRGVREHVIAVRLEPLVDLGILQKKDPYRWRYNIRDPNAVRTLCELDWPNVEALLRAMGLELRRQDESARIWKYLAEGFHEVRSPLGFAGLEETLLVALALATEESSFFEWSTANEVLSQARERSPREVRFNVDRYGAIRHIKLPDELPQ
jgi:hypothetical protein